MDTLLDTNLKSEIKFGISFRKELQCAGQASHQLVERQRTEEESCKAEEGAQSVQSLH